MGKLDSCVWRIILCMVSSIFLFTPASFAEDYRTVQIMVKFMDGESESWPTRDGRSLKITNSTKSSLISEVGVPISIRPLIRDESSVHFSYDGPWEIGIWSNLNGESLCNALLANPSVESVVLLENHFQTAGESTKSWFPESERDLFCQAQSMLHRKYNGENPIQGDACTQISGSRDFDMDLPQAWGITKGDTSIVVAVLDLGFDLVHPNLGGPGPVESVEDSLLYYNQGVWFRNWAEVPGDASPVGSPGW